MVRLSSDLLTLKDSFTTYDYFNLDGYDADVGSGGLMLLPDQSGSIPHLAMAGGKDGRAFLLNRDNMGGYTKAVRITWCKPSTWADAGAVRRTTSVPMAQLTY